MLRDHGSFTSSMNFEQSTSPAISQCKIFIAFPSPNISFFFFLWLKNINKISVNERFKSGENKRYPFEGIIKHWTLREQLAQKHRIPSTVHLALQYYRVQQKLKHVALRQVLSHELVFRCIIIKKRIKQGRMGIF